MCLRILSVLVHKWRLQKVGHQSLERASVSWGNLFCLSASFSLVVYLIMCLTPLSETPCMLLLLGWIMFVMPFVTVSVGLWHQVIFLGEKKLRVIKSPFMCTRKPSNWLETHSQNPSWFSCSHKQLYYTILIHLVYCNSHCWSLHKLVISL